MTQAIRGISSMATRQLLAELSVLYEQRESVAVQFESVGGVTAASRVSDGETFDVVVLAAAAIDKLIDQGAAVAGSRVDIVRSGVAIAVASDAPAPDIGSLAALQDALRAASGIGYSTGPSGTALLDHIAGWGLNEELAAKLVQAPPGVPVGELLAQGEVSLGFQQRSELMHLPGIRIIGGMPPGAEIDTVFSAAVCTACQQREQASQLIAFLASDSADEARQNNGMTAP